MHEMMADDDINTTPFWIFSETCTLQVCYDIADIILLKLYFWQDYRLEPLAQLIGFNGRTWRAGAPRHCYHADQNQKRFSFYHYLVAQRRVDRRWREMPSRGCAAQASSDSDRSNDWFAARLSFISFPARRDFFQSGGRPQPGNSPFAARRAPRTSQITGGGTPYRGFACSDSA
ncbi:MAG: hypothetical protein PHW60_12520 [Kiritimatiellae bacterium]|nr:hypothetical protein [Kiritimatiellia bacterium]